MSVVLVRCVAAEAAAVRMDGCGRLPSPAQPGQPAHVDSGGRQAAARQSQSPRGTRSAPIPLLDGEEGGREGGRKRGGRGQSRPRRVLSILLTQNVVGKLHGTFSPPRRLPCSASTLRLVGHLGRGGPRGAVRCLWSCSTCGASAPRRSADLSSHSSQSRVAKGPTGSAGRGGVGWGAAGRAQAESPSDQSTAPTCALRGLGHVPAYTRLAWFGLVRFGSVPPRLVAHGSGQFGEVLTKDEGQRTKDE